MSTGRIRRSPGWYQDPDDPTRVRHWNGRGWSGRRRPRPTWHVLPNDLSPDPNWVTPGGINAATQREWQSDGDAGGLGGRDERGAGGLGDRPLGLEGPPVEDPRRGLRGRDRPYLEDPLGGNSLDKPLQAEGKSHDFGFRSGPYRADRYRTGFHSSWAAAAAFGLEPGRVPRGGGPGSRPGGAGRPSYRSTIRTPGLLPPVRWKRSRVPVVMVVGLTLFAVVALLINLGTTARGRFSAVSVDATFIGQANVACANALGNRRPGAETVMSSGTTATGSRRTGTSQSSLAPSARVGATAKASGSPAAGTPAALSSQQLARLTRLASQLGRIRLTPAAGPQVRGWLGDWRRYLADERGLLRADAVHDASLARQDLEKAHVAAADADLFADDNGLSACAIDPGVKSGFEPVP